MLVKMNRRLFLQSSGGFLLSLPVLPSLGNAQTDLPKKPRLISVRSLQGAYQDQFFPTLSPPETLQLAPEITSGSLLNLSVMSPIFGSGFSPYKAKTTFVKGLNPLTNYRGHNGSVFLGAFNQEMSSITPPLQPTIDQIIASKAFGYKMDPFNCNISKYEGFMTEGFSWAQSGSNMIRISGPWDPSLNFQKFFSGANLSDTEKLTNNQRRQFVVDKVLESYKALINKRVLASEDKSTLNQHIESLYEIESKIKLATETKGTCANPLIDPSGPWNSSSRYNNALYSKSKIEQVFRLNVDIAIAAIQCDLVRVVNFGIGDNASATSNNHHFLHHMPETPDVRNQMLMIDAWLAGQLIYLLKKLDSTKDSDGKTLLDNSLVLYGKEMSQGNEHSQNSFLTAMFGSLGGQIKTGQMIEFDKKKPYTYNQLLISIMMAFGLTYIVVLPRQETGKSLNSFGV